MRREIVVALCLVLSAQCASAVCYLENANSKCEVCWRTDFPDAEDKVGITTMAECPEDVVVRWETSLPQQLYEFQSYPVKYSISLDKNTRVPIKMKGDGVAEELDIPHANVHSCVASRGACTPFVSDTPGLSTHTAALVANLDADGRYTFESDVQLTRDTYTIIAHVRFYHPHPRIEDSPPSKWDVAIGLQREVLPEVVEITADSYITAAIIGALLLLFLLSVSYAASKGVLDFDKIMEILFSDPVTLTADVISGIADVAAFTVAVFTVLIYDPAVVQIVPIAYLFMSIAWIGSVYNAQNDLRQLYAIYLEEYDRPKFIKTMATRIASSAVHRTPSGSELNSRGIRNLTRRMSTEFNNLCDQESHLHCMLELEMAMRDFRRKRGDVITILSESIPITAIQSYAISTGEANVINIIALLLSAVVFGAKMSGLSLYRVTRLRQIEVQHRFDEMFNLKYTLGSTDSSDSIQALKDAQKQSAQEPQVISSAAVLQVQSLYADEEDARPKLQQAKDSDNSEADTQVSSGRSSSARVVAWDPNPRLPNSVEDARLTDCEEAGWG